MTPRTTLLVITIACSFCVNANTNDGKIWTPITLSKLADNRDTHSSLFEVDKALLSKNLTSTKSGDSINLEIPLPNGEMTTFTLVYDSILSKEMQALYPELKTYKGYNTENRQFSGRFDYTPKGFNGMFKYEGKYVYVEPSSDESGYYTSYNKKSSSPFQDQVLNYLTKNGIELEEKLAAKASTELRTYRLIISTTGEYAQYHGGTAELTRSAITTAINRVNEVFTTDLAVKLELTNFNIYTNPNTDPFTDNNAGADIETNNIDLLTKFGGSTFDVGHLFSTGGGGLAYRGSVCNSLYKGEGVTGSSRPETDAFYISYVAHELGHQFGANHTFNGTLWNCSGSNRNNPTSYEPGSGSTVMAYAGICGQDDLQLDSDAYFHAGSITEINAHLASASCGTSETLSNKEPVANAGSDYTVPASTPLILSGSASDENSEDSLTYVWEQMDTGTGNSNLSIDFGNGPLFRSWNPTSESTRYLPRLQDIISGTLSKGETYATTSRELKFRLTVRDGEGGVSSDDMVITVNSDSGPFSVTYPAAESNVTGTAEVTWNTAGTNNAPINCSQVDLLLSTNNGSSFTKTLLAATENDGVQAVDFSSYISPNAYLMVKCSNNIFFALSDAFNISAPNELVLTNDAIIVVQNGGTTSFNVLGNDSGQGTLTISAVNYSGAGTVTNTNTQISYQPAAGFYGSEIISYTVTDEAGQTATGTLTVTVTETVESLVVTNDSYNINQDSAATLFSVLDNDSGSGSLRITAIDYTGTGSTSISGSQISYQPSDGYSGTDSITYTVIDQAGQTAQATVTIKVTASSTSTPPSSDSNQSSSGGTVNFMTLLTLLFLLRRKLI